MAVSVLPVLPTDELADTRLETIDPVSVFFVGPLSNKYI